MLTDVKLMSFVVVGILTLGYSLIELGIAVSLNSLSLLSDGFHNLSDVISLYIAFWATIAAKREISDKMTYGWVRTEIWGGLTNGMFLISLSLYIVLESIPRFIQPKSLVEDDNLLESLGESTSTWIFTGIAGLGLVVNTLGTLIFAATGTHGHSHAGGGHGHSHGGGRSATLQARHRPRTTDEAQYLSIQADEDADGHGFQSHAGDHHGHSHASSSSSHHGHSHGGGESKKSRWDLNVRAVFLHYLGDMLSSFIVFVVGLLLHFLPHYWWVDYIDPIASLVIVALILVTTVPLVKHCSMILLQATGGHDIPQIRVELGEIDGVMSVHDLHVWQLVDDVSIASVHVVVLDGTDFAVLAESVRQVFHAHGIHSSTVQPEFVTPSIELKDFCKTNCVEDCDQDWCCKKKKDLDDSTALPSALLHV